MREQRVEDVILVFDGVVQLPAQFAHVIHAHRVHGRHAHHDVLRAEPGESLVGKIGRCDPLKQLSGFRARDHQHAGRARQRRHLNRPVARHIAADVIMIQALQRAS